jgi:hypothetical protein
MIVKLAKARVLGETRRRRMVRRLTQPVGVCLRVKCATDSWSFHGRCIKASSWRLASQTSIYGAAILV